MVVHNASKIPMPRGNRGALQTNRKRADQSRRGGTVSGDALPFFGESGVATSL